MSRNFLLFFPKKNTRRLSKDLHILRMIIHGRLLLYLSALRLEPKHVTLFVRHLDLFSLFSNLFPRIKSNENLYKKIGVFLDAVKGHVPQCS